MALKVGSADVQDVKLGAAQVAKVMLGAVQVWPVGPAADYVLHNYRSNGIRNPSFNVNPEQWVAFNNGDQKIAIGKNADADAAIPNLVAGSRLVFGGDPAHTVTVDHVVEDASNTRWDIWFTEAWADVTKWIDIRHDVDIELFI